ncbi:MAG: flagellar hook basal-body protein [Cyanobacteria bacterium SIG26]|nr:flagellar hook basal-body protein [Cyanobacteria bacterium SIG26]MBQ7126948.1 flagellar hook basal-body protein [bacterium]
MYNFQGIISKGINNSLVQWDRFGQIAQNVTNYQTTGYKGITFEQVLREDGYLTGSVRMNNSQGSIKITSNPYDIAIDGAGYIPVVSPNGEVQYTRDGAFKQGKDGYLTTRDGWIVGEGIQIPSNCFKFVIKENGDVMAYDSRGAKAKKVGTIPLVVFENPAGMVQTDMNRLKPTDEAGEAKLVKNHDCIKQNNLEASNVNMYRSALDLSRMNASMIASMQMIKLADQMYNKSINIREG